MRHRAASVLVTVALFNACSTSHREGPYPHEAEPIGTVREIYDGTLSDSLAVNTFRNIHRLFPTRVVRASRTPRELPVSPRPLTDVRVGRGDLAMGLNEYLEANRVAMLLVLDSGRVALERYRFGNTDRTRWMSMSIAKSVTSTLVGAAIRDGRIGAVTDPVTRYVPALAGSAYDDVTVRDVLTMTSGVRWTERYTDPTSDRRRLLEAQISQRRGAALEVMKALPAAAPPGTINTYSTGETQVAGEIVRGATGQWLADYLSERIWQRAGMEHEARWWLDARDGIEIGGSGLSATLRDFGRFGLFILEDGIVGTDTILPPGWVREATSPKVLSTGTPLDYGYLWWTASSDAARLDGAFTAQGIHGQFLYVNPRERVVIVQLSARPHPTQGAIIDDERFFDAVVAALRSPRD
jgi:CubicO group peptidase (beta-lactamase class C family)